MTVINMLRDIKTAMYDDQFYRALSDRSLRSARVVVPILLNCIQAKSVIEIGCGMGGWLRAFQENGIGEVRGFDGPWVNKSQLLFDASKFSEVDLNRPFEIAGKYDLAVCLEVAEHLTPAAGRHLIRVLTQLAPLVLFSAAVPYQGGTEHVNEQWPSYWSSLFAHHGFRWLDPIRRHLWYDSRVDYWYRQNLLLFADAELIAKTPCLQLEEQHKEKHEMGWVRREVVEHILEYYRPFDLLPKSLSKLSRLGNVLRKRWSTE